jgi:putative ABC transport system ATP-binding protein
MQKPSVLLENVSLSLNGNAGIVDILKDISIDIQEGESIGIVGPSGSGKSSLLMLMGGLERISNGKINLLGQNLSEMNENKLASFRRSNVGIIFQSFHLIPTMTALENVAVPLELNGNKDAFGLAEEALVKVGLGDRLSHFPSQLSGGEQQRTALARAVIANPKILLADEPTGNLDHDNGKIVADYLFELHTENKATLVLVTHDLELAERCERKIKISDGEIFTR